MVEYPGVNVVAVHEDGDPAFLPFTIGHALFSLLVYYSPKRAASIAISGSAPLCMLAAWVRVRGSRRA